LALALLAAVTFTGAGGGCWKLIGDHEKVVEKGDEKVPYALLL